MDINEDPIIKIVLANMHETDRKLISEYKKKFLEAEKNENKNMQIIYSSKIKIILMKYMTIKEIAVFCKKEINNIKKRSGTKTLKGNYKRKLPNRNRGELNGEYTKIDPIEGIDAYILDENSMEEGPKIKRKANPREKLIKLQQRMEQNPPKTTIGKTIAALKLDLLTNTIDIKEKIYEISKKDDEAREESYNRYNEVKETKEDEINELKRKEEQIKIQLESLMDQYTKVHEQLKETKGDISKGKKEIRERQGQYVRERVRAKSEETKELMVINKGILQKIGSFLRKKINDFNNWRNTKKNQAEEKLGQAINRAKEETNKKPKLSEQIAATVSESQAITNLQNSEQEPIEVEIEGIEPADD